MVGSILSPLKRSGFSILSCEKGLGLRPRTFFTANNGELLGLYPIRKQLLLLEFERQYTYVMVLSNNFDGSLIN